MYQLCLAALFASLAVYRPHRYEWGVLAILLLSTWTNTIVFSNNDIELYFIRAVLTTLACTALILRGSTLSMYQSVILLLTLLAYGALAIDVAQGERVLIYNHYEAIIYGLVIFQLIGVYPTIRAGYSDWVAGRKPRLEYFQTGKR